MSVKLFGEDLLEMYLLEHPDEEQYVGETMIDGEMETITQGDMFLRFAAWLVKNGHTTQERYDRLFELTEPVRKRHAQA